MKEPIASLYPEVLEAAVRERGPMRLIRDVLQTLLAVKGELEAEDAYHYGTLVWELQGMVLRQSFTQPLQEGANERIRKSAA